MGLETTVFYPFHPLCGRTVAVVSRGKETVTVVAADERRLKIPIWMTRPDAVGYTISEQAAIDLRALLALSSVMRVGQLADHATLSEPAITPATGGEDETVGTGARCEATESQRDTDGHGDAGEAHSIDGDDDYGSCALEQEGWR